MASNQGSAARAANVRSALRKGLLLTIALAVLGAVLGTLVGVRISSTHTATTSILVNPLDGNPFSTSGSGDDLVNLETEAQLVQSQDVGDLVRKQLGTSSSLDDLVQGLDVTVPPNTQILQIQYSTRSGDEAVRRAQAFADNYLDYRESRARRLISNQTRRLDEQIDQLSEEQSDLAQRLSDRNPQSSAASVLQVQLEATATQLNQLQARAAEVQAGATNPGQIVTRAALPATGPLGSWYIWAIGGLLLGVAAAILLALLRPRVDERVRHADDVASAGQVLLGSAREQDALLARAQFNGATQSGSLPDAFKDLRVGLLTTERRRPVVILLATAMSHEESPLTAAGLALATASSHLRTVVVEVVPSELFVDQAPRPAQRPSGTRTALSGMLRVRDDLHLIPRGSQEELEDLLLTPQMHSLFDDLRASADIVFIVSGNIDDPRTRALADTADAIILEAREGVSSYRDLRRASNDGMLAQKMLGVVYVTRGRKPRAPDRSSSTGGDAWTDWSQLSEDDHGQPAVQEPRERSAAESTSPTHAR